MNDRNVERLTSDLQDHGMGEYEARIRAKAFLRKVNDQ